MDIVDSTEILTCTVCGERVPVKLTFAEPEFEGPLMHVSIRASDVEAAWLEHALAQGENHA